MKRIVIAAVIAIAATSCFKEIFQDRDGDFLSDVVRLDEFNSEYDDYNSDLPKNKWGETILTFSSKRAKKKYFNLVSFMAEFTYDKRLGLSSFKNAGKSYDFLDAFNSREVLALSVNGNFNVLGPKTVSLKEDFPAYSDSPDDLILFYADDSEGNLEIKYVVKSKEEYSKPARFDLLNSKANDAYPSFSWSGDKLYFCSDRDGNFDIYEVSIPRTSGERITLESLVHPKIFTLKKVEELSSAYDDKCPYVYGNTLVFVSNRPGGKGGTDIYYSTLKNDKWSAPVNAGDRINTAYNEYRPILPSLNYFTYNLMIFSSDRPGGKGGFDLYMTGLNQRW